MSTQAKTDARGLSNLQRHARIAPNQRCDVTLVLRRRNTQDFESQIRRAHAGEPASVERAAFAERFGADPADLDAVAALAKAHQLALVSSVASHRAVTLSGPASTFETLFATKLYHYSHDRGTFRGFEPDLTYPTALKDCVTAVLGLDNRALAKPHFRVARQASLSYTPLQVAARYGFPEGNGATQCIAIIELGGGYQPADLSEYFTQLGVALPDVVAISVDNATNQPSGSVDGPDGEVMLDIEVAGSIAPGAKLAIYFAPNTDAGFLNAISTAVHDTNEAPDVVSISWGGPETSWTAAAMQAMDAALADAVLLGITVCIAAGDNGASDGVTSGGNHVDFPASSPHALACGGTSLSAQSETVWNDGSQGGATGGGVSTVFSLPSYQKGLSIEPLSGSATALTMRGVPDVAGDADPDTGYEVRVDGANTVIGGTSAVAPLWAGLIARLNGNATQKIGFLPPHLYAMPATCHDVTQGNNEGYVATKGWDACTGLGSPRGATLATLAAHPTKKKAKR